jgi:hypothetical protein
MSNIVFYCINRDVYNRADDDPPNEIRGPRACSFSEIVAAESTALGWDYAWIIAVRDNGLSFPAERIEYIWVISDSWWDDFDTDVFNAYVAKHLYEDASKFSFRKRSDPYRWQGLGE